MNKIRNGLDTLRRQLGWKLLRVAAGLTIVCLLLSFFKSGGPVMTSWAQGTTTVSIDPASQEVCLGDTTTTDVMVEDVVNLYGATFEISFNPALVEVVGTQIQPGDFLSPDWILDNTVDNNNGTITYSVCQMNPSQPVTGTGVLATITWRGKAGGTSPIHFTSVQLGAPGGVPIPSGTEDGEIIVGVAPTITCRDDMTEPNDPGRCSAVVTWPDPAITGYPAPTVNCNPPSGSTFPVGTTTVTCSATNTCGSAQCTFEVTVEDTEDPTITCPGDVSVNSDAGACYATGVDLGTPTTDDNCDVASVTNDAPNQFPVGETTVTWTVTDIHGNTATCTQKVTVVDNENPTITCPADVSVNNDPGACYATGVDLGTPTTDDNCGVASVTNDAPSQFPVGETTVTWTVTDIHGNTATCTQKVTVVDNENPTITCPPDVTVKNDPGESYATNVDLGTPTTDDNCGVASVTNDAPSQFPMGETIVTWTVTDIHGNTATCTQKVTVVANDLPVADADGPYSGDRTQTVTLDGSGSYDPDGTVTNYEWQVDGAQVYSGPSATYGLALSGYSAGAHTVRLIVTDNDGATDDDTTSLTVNNFPPVADADGPCSGNRTQTVTLDGSGSYDPDGTITNYEWQVDGAQVYSGPNATYGLALSGYSLGAHTVRLIVTDNDGATDDDTTNLTVNNAPPVANDDFTTTDEDTPVGIDVTANDSDPDGTIDPTTVSIVSGPSHGSVSVDPVSGEVTYTPDPDYNGDDSFAYTVDDDDGATSNEATVTVTVNPEHGTAIIVTLVPASKTISAGESIAYTVWATDTHGTRWNATFEASYAIDSGAGGSWAKNVYTSEFAGTWMITATVDSVDDNATLTVEHGTATTVTLSPASTTITAGQSQAYTVWATDAYGNGWDATSEASYAIASGAGGSWADNVYTSEFAGDWTVTATVDGVSDEATLTVNNPAPILTSLSPISATVGGPAFTLTVNGTNFVSGSVVHWSGSARTTTFVSNTRLTAAMTASDIATVGTVNVTVINPSPGGGTSNALPFEIAEMSPEPPSIYIYLPIVFNNSSSPRHMPHR